VWWAALVTPGEVMKLSELRWEPSALRPHCDVNVPREALRPARGAGATAVASWIWTKS
jgi:hypothetical protein